ncbi:MAG: HAD-IA family hydrolase [Candidatus Bathyarchaeota archaeon]|jgi:putative hydrolase of the HAD superfamily|nr:HAD-IA family hydrolase [Candidatus Bathyarchaeota archaeon]
MQIEAVLFDLDNTLIRTAEIPEIYRRIAENYGVRLSTDEIREAHKDVGESNAIEGMITSGQEFWVRWNAEVLEKAGIQENKAFLARKIDELWWEYADLEVYPDVIETLTQLKSKGLKTGVITNGLKRDYEQILGELKLTDFFDIVIGIDTCNKAKPDKEIFLHAINILDVHPEQAVFIGDSVKYDYEGARHAGLKPLLIDREGKASESLETIRSLTEVLLHV